jgi:hypothetical protein
MRTFLIYAVLIMPGLIVAYALFLRPILHAIPRFQKFYTEADGFWEKVWALCGKSVKMVFAYFIQAVGWMLQSIDPIANFFGDPDLRQQITDGLQANPKYLGYFCMFISVVTIASHAKKLVRDGDE